jgi:uncharacterized LabA/DUF88 family protein
MEENVCVFIDGENFRHAINNLFSDEFDKKDYLPKAVWGDLFDWIVKDASKGNGQRLRTYWYVIEHLDFFPYKFPSTNHERGRIKLQRLLSKHAPYKEELQSANGARTVQIMNRMVSDLYEKKNIMRQRFDQWTGIQNEISSRNSAIEFRRAGAIRYNLFDNQLGSEKAVDVKLATDLITLKDIYDVAVIVSGDQDYVPAVQVIKDYGKRAVNVSFLTRSGKLLPGGARRLNHVTDWSLDIRYEEFKPFLNL